MGGVKVINVYNSPYFKLKDIYVRGNESGTEYQPVVFINDSDYILINNTELSFSVADYSPVVRIQNSSYPTIGFSEIYNGGWGIELLDVDHALIHNNTIHHYGAHHGIDSDGWSIYGTRTAGYHIIRDNYFYNGYGGSHAIYMYSSSDYCQIYRNVIEGGSAGITFYNSRHGRTWDNVIKNVTYDGIYFVDTTSVNPRNQNHTSTRDIIFNPGRYGVHIERYGTINYMQNITFQNLVVAYAGSGGLYLWDAEGTIKNTILYNNSGFAINLTDTSNFNISYNLFYNNTQNIVGTGNLTYIGMGNISADPLFADPANGDFHLKSQAGRWNGTDWVNDNETSPCVDAGDLNSSYSNESYPHGQRINIGAYGNTPEASKSPYHKIYLGTEITIHPDLTRSYPLPPKSYYGNLTLDENFSATPTSNPVTINITRFNTSLPAGQILINFTANTTDGNNVNFTVCSLKANQKYLIKRDGIYLTTKQANSSGCVFFNNSLWSEHTFTLEQDETPPTISITYPTSNSIFNTTIITINITSTDSNLDYTNISIYNSTGDLVNSTTDSTNGTYSITLSVPADGVYNITATAYDNAGNSNSTTVTNVTIDTTPPTTTDDAPSGWQSSAFNITLTCSDSGSGCNLTQYRIDGGSWQNGTMVEITTDGNHTIEYNSTDNAGNTETTNTVYAALDTTPPTISFSCSPTSVYIWETITCSCSATDNLDPNPQVSYTVNPPTSAIGTITTTCTATDRAGNKNSKSISYTVRSRPSGGGGTYTPLPKQIHSWTKITPGVATIMKITKKEIGLKQIQIEVKNPANNVRITVTKLEGKPASVTQEISGKVYKYLEINAENLNETNLERAKIQFEVNKTWVLENNLDKNRIYLYRFVNNEWEKLTTRLLNETDNYINYEAETPGFSYFAIAGEEKVCEEGEKRCKGNILEQCINNSWQTIENCTCGCNGTALKCNPKPVKEKIEKICEEGTRSCVDNNLQECRNNRWQTIEICEYGCNSTSLTCNPAPAEKSEKRNYLIYILILLAIIGGVLSYLYRDKINRILEKLKE